MDLGFFISSGLLPFLYRLLGICIFVKFNYFICTFTKGEEKRVEEKKIKKKGEQRSPYIPFGILVDGTES